MRDVWCWCALFGPQARHGLLCSHQSSGLTALVWCYCRNNSTGTVLNSTLCDPAALKPDTIRDCLECECDSPNYDRQCSCNGYIATGADECQCDSAFTGKFCDTTVCPAAWTPEECECCPSGIVSTSGACCVTDSDRLPSLDRFGQCCYDQVDGCGDCGGDGVMRDSKGTCCKVCAYRK